MPVLTCEKYPQMLVYTTAGSFRFTEGQAEVTAEQAEAVEAIAEAHGITIEQDEDQEQGDTRPPAKSASKSDWVAYVVARGMTVEEAEASTRDALAAQYAEGGGGGGSDE